MCKNPQFKMWISAKSKNQSIITNCFAFKTKSVLLFKFRIEIKSPKFVSIKRSFKIVSLIGAFVPLFLNKRGIDPAIATGPFITTSNAIFGILIYFMIAKLILGI